MNNDSTSTVKSPLTFKNVFSYEKQKYFYREPDNENYFSSAVIPGILRRNLKSLENLQNTSTIAFQRSEEHTSELQSRGHLVCRLLLEKKKKNLYYIQFSLYTISFCFTASSTTNNYTLSLHDALPIF